MVHVAYADAEPYTRWGGKEIPAEAEWEFVQLRVRPGGASHAPSGWLDRALDNVPRRRWLLVDMAANWKTVFPSAAEA